MSTPDGDPPGPDLGIDLGSGLGSGLGDALDRASLFDRLGGTAPLRTAINDFYRAVLADPTLAPYFDHADVAQIKDHQLALFTQLLGGGDQGPHYPERRLAAAHQPLRIPVEHYQLVVGHLVATLVGMGIPDDVFAAIGQIANDVQPDIVFTSDDHNSQIQHHVQHHVQNHRQDDETTRKQGAETRG